WALKLQSRTASNTNVLQNNDYDRLTPKLTLSGKSVGNLYKGRYHSGLCRIPQPVKSAFLGHFDWRY
ncbi:hypothetical protein R7F07_25475, partial [Vibrio sp. YT-16]|uniref:hypothetical protein n=1 Tax=Vibrio sp. YT-16 TaxID=3074707 RepID=UPI002964E690